MIAAARVSQLHPNSKGKAKEKEKRQKSANKPQTERLKTVVRRLPPNLPEDIFWQSVQQWVTDETVQWKAYYQGKFRKRVNKENIPSRAYIAFRNEDQLAVFSRDYDGHLFRDKAGNESIAVVEFSPYQKIPSEKKKVDGRTGTIEKDEDYISFLKSLQEGGAKPVDGETIETLIAASQPPPQPTTTPLLEALKAEKSAQKDKEAILRNHAHYKDASVAASAKKKDEKKSAAGGAAKPAPAEQPLGKKAKKAAAKAAQQPAASSSAPGAKTPAPTPTTQGQAKPAQPGQSAKAPRLPRERQPKHSPAPAPGAAATPSPAALPSQPGADASTSTSGDAAAVAQSGPSRRRPVLGLGSRQFEAALSGAGVSGRPPRRGQAQDKDKDKGTADTPSAPGEAAPKTKEKRAGQPAAPPTILQRDVTTPTPKILTRDGAVGGATPATDGVIQEETPGVGGRGGRRGRGRGRGGPRGGAP
ncbi:Smg-4/UPF3 family-domain-containing protein [Fomitopsis serialis]|uniref:Smg-4/UPF3 family-domain-containing protein n=1 Tax=Fomitopsis serialis TaxID=139415 RepID=UPI0020083E46|nr:Smg-4/UPF3 family-domain-containing protein [Neoantrodia serialis]KAH9925165.1 Smg-4/UPF3 family-domain-containing protein [Neoantrodia serialis]